MAIIKRTNSDYSIQTPTGSNITLQTDNILVTNNIITSGNISSTGTITATGGIIGSSTFGVAGILYANSAVVSTSNSTGGLVAAGGAAVGGNLYVGQNLVVTGNLNVLGTQTVFSTNNTSFADSIIYLADDNTANILDLGIISSFTNGFYQHTGLVRDATDGVWKLFANVATEPTTTVDFTDATYAGLQVGSLNSTLTTAASSVSTGAIVTAGGLGVAGAAFIGTTLNTIGETKLTGKLYANSTIASTTTATGAITTAGGVGIAGDVFVGGTVNTTGKIYSNSAIASTTTATGAITTAGGVGIAGDVFVGGTVNTTGKIYSNSAIASTSTTTGAITTAGGVGIAGNVYVGQNAIVAGNETVTGNVTVGNLAIVAKNMLLNSALGSGTTPTGEVGITINRGILANVQIRYTEEWQTWQITNNGSTYANISTTTGSGIYMQNVSDDLFPSLGANLNTVSFTIKSTAGNIRIDSNITPVTTSVYDIGSSALKFANVNVVNVNTDTLISSGAVIINDVTTSTSSTTGALKVAGGLGVAGNINIGSTIASTSTSTGALVVAGGLGVAGAIFATNLTGTLQTAAQPNITSVGTLTSIAVSGTTTINSGNAVTAIINGGTTGVGNIGASGQVFNTVFATSLSGTLTTAAQPNITSVGTLTSIAVSGTTTINSGNAVTAIINGGTTGVGNIGASGQVFNTVFATSLSGTLTTAAQPNITSVGTLTSLTTSGTTTINSGNAVTAIINGGTTGVGNIGASGQVFNTVFATSLSGTLTTAAQPNITSVGTLSALTVSATITGSVSGSALTVTQAAQSAITSVGTLTSLTTSGTITVNSGNAVTAIINGGTTGVGNIGSVTTGFNTVYAKATSAVYADLAEIYASDANYAPGTVVVFGGLFEVTESTTSHDTRVAGVVSTNPAYLMNDKATGVAVALQGRVPCHVQGPISKGDLVVASAIPGVAGKLNNALYDHGCVIGKSLDTITDTSIQIIEVVVGRV